MRYKYLGEQLDIPGMLIGPTVQIRLKHKDGTVTYLNAPDPNVGFIKGRDIGLDITDPKTIRFLDADDRFQRI